MIPILVLPIAAFLLITGPAFSNGPSCVQIDYKLGHIFKPGCVMAMPQPGGGPVSLPLNKMGLRDKDYSAKPAPGTFRILFMGPSTLVNLTEKVGVVAGFREELLRLWAKERKHPLLKKFKKVEVIAAGEAGYHIVQSSIRLPQLLEAYHPHLVIFTDFFSSNGLQLIFDHNVAKERDRNTGLATALGDYPRFWPFPESWSYKFWQKSWGNQAHIYSVALRMALLNFRLRFFPNSSCGADNGGDCIIALHRQYLESMRNQALSYKSDLLVLWLDSLKISKEFPRESNPNREVEAWYKPSWVALKITPWDLVTLEHERVYNETMRSGTIPAVEFGNEYWSSRIESSRLVPGEYHLEGTAGTQFGATVSKKVFPAIQEWFGKKAEKKKSR